MRVKVESYTGDRGVEMVRRLRIDGRDIEITENIGQWPGPGYRHHKVKARDGNLYLLRRDEGRAEWELTMFQRPEAAGQSADVPIAKPKRPTIIVIAVVRL